MNSAPKKRTWVAPKPKIERAHDVRKLRVCFFCENFGDSLLVIEPKKKHGHAYCIVKDGGFEALGAMPSSEINKTTLNDMLALGVKLDDILRLVKAAERRERKAAW